VTVHLASAPGLEPQSAPRVRHLLLRVDTVLPFEIVDVTTLVDAVVQSSGLVDGLAMVQTRHTTTGVLINEHEPLLFDDLRRMFQRLAPRWPPYAHDDVSRRTVNLTPGERRNGHAHCRAALLRTSESLMVANGRLSLGTWQRVLFVDFDGGQRRQLSLTLMGDYRAPSPVRRFETRGQTPH
jgi:secondary thiamine-phosphate synthase enzyme